MADLIEVISGSGQEVGRGEELAPFTVRLVSEEDGSPVGGAVVSYFVDDVQGTGTDFRGGSPVMVTSSANGIATTDVPLIAGDSAGRVDVKAIAESARCTLTLHVR
ncbi:hypothetical protein U9R90_10440 [Streptomyces sp. E11-3]|uniref:hypothetical protein n=1 Tax=Streptomyces sp. E11-3 TaxID=3110112 RepID=UPI0039805458